MPRRHPAVELVCTHCQRLFKRNRYRLPQSHQYYCSRACFRLHHASDVPANFVGKIGFCLHDALCPYCCWLWHGYRNEEGYGVVSVRDKPMHAHRHMWILLHPHFPASFYVSLVVRHLCHERSCLNPWHLMIGTPALNSRDMVNAGHSLVGERHHMAKLTVADVQRIRLLAQQGIGNTAIAKQFNVTATAIYLIVHRHNWPHVL